MKKNVDIFMACTGSEIMKSTINELAAEQVVESLYLLTSDSGVLDTVCSDKCKLLPTETLTATKLLRSISRKSTARYVVLFLRPVTFRLGYRCIERMIGVAEDTQASMVYADRYEEKAGTVIPHPTIDYQAGSVRDDFDFGGLWLIRTEALRQFIDNECSARYRYAAPYALRLFLSRQGRIFHLNEFLYTEVEEDLRDSGEKQFDYVNPANRDVQIENERACTEHLKRIGAWLAPHEIDDLPHETEEYPVEASVIIPVRNRIRTIRDAIDSVLSQEASFDFNVIVVDNHSDDGTAEAVKEYTDPRVILLQAERTDLGIGGCWDMAVRDGRCGRFAVQLDSDDLYSANDTLARIVAAFGRQNVAMVIGAYRMVNFKLETLPPGLIDHREWTAENGRNNALRINGLGAPRAFRTSLLRKIGFPNTSYGEDYALGLAFSRHYRIGRIYEELYLCRRWDGNSDAALPVEKINRNNLYKDRLRTLEIQARQEMLRRWNHEPAQEEVFDFFDKQMRLWEEARLRFEDLEEGIQVRSLPLNDYELAAQFNPRRIVSTAAKLDKKNLKKRPCFLCDRNRPGEQIDFPVEGDYHLLVNPYPILPYHLTIPTRRHQPQSLSALLRALNRLAWRLPDFLLFYNGARCGASAPDHAHLQAGARGIVPLERDWKFFESRLEKIYPKTTTAESELLEKGYTSMSTGLYRLHGYACPAFVLLGGQADGDYYLFNKLLSVLPVEKGQNEPDINLLAWRQSGRPADGDDSVVMVLFPRKKHRPDCYYADERSKFVISPGALDMGGLIITPRENDFERLTAKQAAAILKEVTLSDSQVDQIAKKLNTNKSVRTPSVDFSESITRHEPEVSVGILREDYISFTLNGAFTAKGSVVTGPQEARFRDGGILWNGNVYSELTFHPETPEATFRMDGVVIGVRFHWERKESQTFKGTLRIVVDEEKLVIINQLPVEDYLMSVISSEMRSTSSAELLKAHAVVSRSWLFYQMQQRRTSKGHAGGFFSFVRKDDEFIRWYDREDHVLFDVCADDHCQRYQGVTRANSAAVADAVKDTRGLVLMYEGQLCDARFSKCCGGVTERYSTCWEEKDMPYLLPVSDNQSNEAADLSAPEDANRWIQSSPDAFCNTDDPVLLSQVLNDYDQETSDFYRWTVRYTQKELSELIQRKREEDFGDILALEPLERGTSGRIKRLRIVGSKKTLVIGKELEIRRTLSDTHLYSSAFTVECEMLEDGMPTAFILYGAGWGHGVGLCQIGAAVMASKGYDFRSILMHYYKQAKLQQLYK